MTAPAAAPPTARPGPPRPAPAAPERKSVPWGIALCSGLAVILAGFPVGAIVADMSWLGHVVGVVVLVVVVGLALHRAGTAIVTAAQCLAVLVMLTVTFT